MSTDAEFEDMQARLRAIYEIASGGPIPRSMGPSSAKPVSRTPGCNCDADGILNPDAHALGCPISPSMRPIRTNKVL